MGTRLDMTIPFFDLSFLAVNSFATFAKDISICFHFVINSKCKRELKTKYRESSHNADSNSADSHIAGFFKVLGPRITRYSPRTSRFFSKK